VAIGVTALLGVVAWLVARRWGEVPWPGERAASSADRVGGVGEVAVRKAWRALAAPSRALWWVTSAIDRGLWGERPAPGPRRPSGEP
jgi:hypothetical protein